VVDHSMSGMIAQYLMAQYPDRIKSVVAIRRCLPFKTDAAGLGCLRVITDDEAFRNAVTARTSNATTSQVERKMAMACRAAPEAMLGYLAAHRQRFRRSRGRPDTPVALITGARTSAITVAPASSRIPARLSAPAGRHHRCRALSRQTPILLAALIERAVFSEPLTRNAQGIT
jgi:pimeloyl-ACP methyl ester carboxylesterase